MILPGPGFTNYTGAGAGANRGRGLDPSIVQGKFA